MKASTVACVAAMLMTGLPAHAEKLDLSLISCKQFFEALKRIRRPLFCPGSTAITAKKKIRQSSTPTNSRLI